MLAAHVTACTPEKSIYPNARLFTTLKKRKKNQPPVAMLFSRWWDYEQFFLVALYLLTRYFNMLK